jgi:hypothetical protein
MFNLILILLTILVINTNLIFFEVLLYLIIGSFSLLWIKTIFTGNGLVYEALKKAINPKDYNIEASNNIVSIQIVIVLVPLIIAKLYILSSLWLISSIIQHRAFYYFIKGAK